MIIKKIQCKQLKDQSMSLSICSVVNVDNRATLSLSLSCVLLFLCHYKNPSKQKQKERKVTLSLVETSIVRNIS